jgi:signal transduction histidine kinase
MKWRWVLGAATATALAGTFAVLAWMSAEIARLEASESDSRHKAAREQAANLALWRMDLAMARLVAEEGVRSLAQYRQADRSPDPAVSAGQVPVQPRVLMHFEIDAEGSAFSAEVAAGTVPSYRLQDLVAYARKAPLRQEVRAQAIARQRSFAIQTKNNVRSDQQLRNAFVNANAQVQLAQDDPPEKVDQAVTPLWFGDALVLARRVRTGGEEHLLGGWIDWLSTSRELLDSIRDLLPEARLIPVRQPGAQRPYMLASIPVELEPGEPAHLPPASHSARRGLIVAWVALGLTVLALGLLVAGTLVLSERKSTFASAVTHELRTPLTTFRVYTEMLEGGMVAAAEVPSYLKTLHAEADRMAHLVENVFAWSRVERGRFGEPRQVVDLKELLERDVPRLRDWARGAGMELIVDMAPLPDGQLRVRGDPTAIGQILFNLVDNACKYARQAADKRIELTLGHLGAAVRVAVRDHGPGIAKAAKRRLFRGFTKAAADAATSAPGIGLGLSLSRRLARAMGGDLVLSHSGTDGTEIALTLAKA